MKVPIGWLRDYVDVTHSSDELAEHLATLGFPVEEIIRRPPLSGVKVGRLLEVQKHPNADRLFVTRVDVGAGEPLGIVTGADNVAAGQCVPVATIGARLVGLEIAPRTMRGIPSQGMLCSADELGLEPGWFDDGILQLETDLAPGLDFVDAFRLNDDVLDVEVTANRVDAMSVLGIARELAAALELPLHEPDSDLREFDEALVTAEPSLESNDCRRFIAQRFSVAQVGVAPFWMRVRLALAGQRPIDGVVDVTNFVMLELAQPLHVYDFEKLAGGRLIARDARDGELLRTLDGEERRLDSRFLVIADEREVQGLAGLKGGASSEITPQSRELVLESATFNGPRIRRMSAALGLRTEASARHEKGLPPALAAAAAARAARLLHDRGARAGRAAIGGKPLEAPQRIAVPPASVRALLGIDVAIESIEKSLRALGFSVSSVHAQAARPEDGALEVTPPYWRPDVRIKEDVIEEVGRVVGYDAIPSELPVVYPQTIASTEYDDERRVSRALAALGYRETVNLSLQPASVAERYREAGQALAAPPVEVRNPLSEDQRYLRFSLLPSLLATVARHEGDEPLRLFELGHVFEQAQGAPFETAMCAWLLAQPKRDEPSFRDSGFLEFKGEALAFVRDVSGREPEACSATHAELHPGKTASLLVRGSDVAAIGALDPRLTAAYGIRGAVYAGLMRMSDLPAYLTPQYAPPSRFPAVVRDLALVVDAHMPAMDIEHAIRTGSDDVAEVRVFDEYRGPQIPHGKKSVAVRVSFQRPDRTLTDAEADAQVQTVLASLAERCGAEIRR